MMLQLDSIMVNLQEQTSKRLDIGFTGTRRGMTMQQLHHVRKTLRKIESQYRSYELWAHHGDCVGSDEQFHELAIASDFNMHIHPPSNPKLRAYCEHANHALGRITIVESTKPYKIRNGDIVRTSNLMICTPHLHEKDGSQIYSGTWSTIRIARLRKVPYVIYYSDGRREGGNGWKKLLRS